MNPPSGATSAHAEASPAESSVETGIPVDQFIWENAGAPAKIAAPEDDENDDPEVAPETPGENDETPTHIVVLSEDEEETSNSWRRQLISALRDADRDASHTKSHPTEPPSLPPADVPHEPPIALVANRPTRGLAPPPVERRPRNRTTPVLFGISAAVGLLTIALPRTTNAPETATEAATSTPMITGSLVPAAGEGEFKPIILNSPVLIREGMSRGQATALRVGPVIETVRTVPVQLGTRPQVAVQMSETAPAIEQPAPPLALPQPPPTPAPPPSLDRDGMTALIANKPAAPVEPPAAAAPPVRVEPTEKTASAPPEAAKPAKARSPQVSTAYQRSIRKTPRKKNAGTKRAQTKTANRSSQQAEWNTRRQGLRTSPPPKEEPSTMVKLLKSMWPFSSKEDDAPKAQSSSRTRDASAPATTKNSFWWGEKESNR